MDSVRSYKADEIVNMMKRTPLFMTEVDDLGIDGEGMFSILFISLLFPSLFAEALIRSILFRHNQINTIFMHVLRA